METNIFKQISCLDHELKEYMVGGVELHKMLNLTQFQILLYLFKNENEDVCQKDLQKEIHLKKASITASLDSLEDKGLVYRETSESDGRKNYIRLSEKTKGFSDAFKERSRQLYERIEKDLSKKELEVFSDVIDKIREHIREAEDETDL